MPRTIAAVLMAGALVCGLVYAAASSLLVTATGTASVTGTHPCPGTAAATATNGSGITYVAASVTLPAGCSGRALNVRMTSGATVLTGTATVPESGPAVVTFSSSYDASAAWTVQAVVSGWDMPTGWSFVAPAIWCTVTSNPSATCAATVSVFTGTKPGGSGLATYYDVVVTTTSTSFVRWQVTFNLDNPLYGTRPTRLGNSGYDAFWDGAAFWNGATNSVTRQSACSAVPFLSVAGNNWSIFGNNFRDVRNDRVRQFSLVVNRTEPGYSDVLAPGC